MLDAHAREAYLEEVRQQCHIAHWALEDLRKVLERQASSIRRGAFLVEKWPDEQPSDDDLAEAGRLAQQVGNDNVRALGLLQQMLAAAGVLFWLLWPSTKYGTPSSRALRAERAAELRAFLDIDESSPLHSIPGGSEDVRGALLHVDEMIDEAVASGERPIVTFALGTLDEAEAKPGAGVVRILDDKRMIARIGGRTTNLEAIDAELARVRSKIHVDATVRFVRRKRVETGGSGTYTEFRTAGVRPAP